MADLIFGIPLFLFGACALIANLDISLYEFRALGGWPTFAVFGIRTLVGILPLLMGCRLIFRKARVSNDTSQQSPPRSR